MSNLKPVPGELRATVHITRKETGITETHEVVGHADPKVLAQIQENRRREAAGEALDPELLIQPDDIAKE